MMDIGNLLQSLLGRLVHKAVKTGISQVAKSSSKPPPNEAETAQVRAARDMVKRARKAANLNRKIGR